MNFIESTRFASSPFFTQAGLTFLGGEAWNRSPLATAPRYGRLSFVAHIQDSEATIVWKSRT
jgi:hypothetical protein